MDQPFQSYEDISNPATCAPRLRALRAELKAHELDGFVVPHSDAHMGEYLPPHAERLAWLTAFTGSAGMGVALMDKAAVFVDGRYTLQVRAQTDTALFEPHDLTDEGPQKWIAANLPSGAKLGYDPWLHTAHGVAHLRAAVAQAGGTLVACPINPIDAVWTDQPSPPMTPAKPHVLALAGEESSSKRRKLADTLKKAGAEATVITLGDSVCWLLNIRGHDVPHTPFALAFAIAHADGTVDLFLHESKRTPELIAHLGDARLHTPDQFEPALDALAGKSVLVDPAHAAAAIFDRLKAAGARIIPAPDPCLLPKARKNPTEVEGMRQAHIRDGVAMVRFLAWLETHAASGRLTEIDAARKLEDFRRASGLLSDVSFDTISGSGPNGAVVHYRVTAGTNRVIGQNEMYLVDSGAQYPDGTTDITRTVIVGSPTEEMRACFTRVLQGHIALATARFPTGTIGMQLDSFARRPLWEAGLDYDHGTGHGVGSYLAVHEGPQNISKKPVMQPLLPGMICSNEPGYYKAGAFGIRIENLVVVTKPEPISGGERPMMGLETITLVPIDRNLIATALLTDAERGWIDAYHARVRDVIGPRLEDADTKAWLDKATAPLEN